MWQNFREFWARPYRDDMDAVQWFWFFGLVIIISALWAIVFRHIAGAFK